MGYNNKVTDGTKYPVFGASFLPISGSATYKLGSLVPSNSSVDDDWIQVINSTTLNADKVYRYLDKETADYIAEEEGAAAGTYDDLIGWWNCAYEIGDADGDADGVEVKSGDGFLGLFESKNEITFNFPSSLYTGE